MTSMLWVIAGAVVLIWAVAAVCVICNVGAKVGRDLRGEKR